ncbi:MHC class II transactivator isoform X1 [Takifugu rubripes]|uniref:MHC class II transactivator isoform X1 n=2 Tax=Takifugu rubripes TaxID=31033 RepID=UPI001145766B|nr:MHC class II transactivator isoform X1 [Takifugu rubripes]XP_029691974.1 MHC class II transactivator isoform X1 [Takifugu rubripes]
MEPLSQNCTWPLCKVCPDCAINRCSQIRVEHAPAAMDSSRHDCCYSWFHDKTKELPRSLAPSRTDCGGLNEGNLEHVAGRLTIPLWQNWDRGHKLLLPLIAPVEPVGTTSQSRAAATDTVWSVDAETELAFALAPFGVNMEGFPPDQGGIAKGPESSENPKMPGLGRVLHGEEGGPDTEVLETHFSMTPDNLGWMSSGLGSFGSAEGSPGAKMQDEQENLPTCPDLADPGTRMQDVDEVPNMSLEFGDLPEDLSEFLNEQYIVDPEVLLGDPLWNYEEGPSKPGASSEPHDSGSLRENQEAKQAHKTEKRAKPLNGPEPQPPSDDNTPCKRQRVTDTDQELELGLSDCLTTPPRVLQLHPPMHLITIPDPPLYQVVHALSISSPVITIPCSPLTSTFILVPASSPPKSLHPSPLSPADGTVAPVQMSSSPPGSLSDTASRAVSPPHASPPSPINEGVRVYILEAKAHMSQSCEVIKGGLTLSSHYVDVQVSQREIVYRCGKNTNKVQDKELIFNGDAHRQKSLLDQSQIFDGSLGDNPKRYILLMGDAGMGKSTLIKKLCLNWSKDHFPQFDFVFLLDGKMLALTKPIFSLQTLLLNFSSFATACFDPDAVFAQVMAAPKRVLIIFDGFAEVRDFETLLQTQEKDLSASLQKDSKAQTYTIKQLFAGILQRAVLRGCTLVLSTRPRGAASQVLRRTDSYLEVCGFSVPDVETYVSRYFTDPTLRESALEHLKSHRYLHLLCWNPGLCRLVCSVLEGSKNIRELPRTLTELCRQVLDLRVKGCSPAFTFTPSSVKPENTVEAKEGSSSSEGRVQPVDVQPQSSESAAKEGEEEKAEEATGVEEGEEPQELLSQLSCLAWDGVKSHTSVIPDGKYVSPRLKAFGLRTGLLDCHDLRTTHLISSGEIKGGGGKAKGQKKTRKKVCEENATGREPAKEHILLWANPYLQSYLAALHLCLSRVVSHRTFFKSLPLLSGPKSCRRCQREVLELTQRFAFGILMEKLETLDAEASLRDALVAKQTLLTKHLEDLSHGGLSPAQLLQACHYVYEVSLIRGSPSTDGSDTELKRQSKLPEVLAFRGVPIDPLDAFVVWHVLERAGQEGHSFSLDLEDSGIQISGLRALVGLSNINTYRACIADVVTLWEQLKQSGEESLLQRAVSKFKIHPLKASQVCHIEHLAKLVNVHMQKRFPNSSSQSDPILAEGVPAVTGLHRLELELGPDKGSKALPKLWELLPGLHNLEHLDLENSKIGDRGAENLADALVSLRLLEVLNLSQNCIGDKGMKKLAITLRDLPKLHCLSLYSNMISDEGAKSLAAVLPYMASLTDLDVKYNELTDVGAESLGASLKKCKNIKTLRMWNQLIPCRVFERLRTQDNRILWH